MPGNDRTFCTVVRQENKHGVVQLANFVYVIDQATDMVIHGVHHACVNRHASRFEGLLFRAQRLPGDRGRHVEALEHGWQNACAGQTLAARCTQVVPPTGVCLQILVAKFRWRLHGYMYGLEGDVGKKRLLCVVFVANVLNGFVDEVFGRIEVLGQCRRLTVLKPIGFGVNRQIGALTPVVGAGVGQHQRPIKSSLTGFFSLTEAQMPLAAHQCSVPRTLQHLGNGWNICSKHALIGRCMGLVFGYGFRNIRHTYRMTIEACHQHGTSGRTGSRYMEVRKAHTRRRKAVNIGRIDFATVGTQIRKS